ncbi:MAG: uroporphyrinogen decarboxylase family protein, partial [Anaerolineae bacterium]|nr:uroporphyrinogen decarboxylase family protein [Anaerolineae bacterium]
MAALSHQQPERVPFAWNFGPTPEMTKILTKSFAEQGVNWHQFKSAVDDILVVSPRYIGPALIPHTDIWGIKRTAQSYGAGAYDEISNYPLQGIEDVRLIKDYPWPSPDYYALHSFKDEILVADPHHEKARKLAINVCGNPFEIYCWMTGLEQALINLLLAPDIIHTALERITDYFATRLQRTLELVGDELDILYFADDLGGQNNLLVSLKTYRRMIKPYHQRLFTIAHKLAPHTAVMF